MVKIMNINKSVKNIIQHEVVYLAEIQQNIVPLAYLLQKTILLEVIDNVCW